MDMRDIVREGYEKGGYDEIYRKDRDLTELEHRMFRDVEQKIPDGSAILDLGCGTGVPYDRYLVERGYLLTGVDFTEKHLSLARKRVPEGKFISGDITSIDFAGASFAAVISLYTIFHVPAEEHEKLFRRIHGMLNDGGMLLVTLGTGELMYSVEEDWPAAPIMAWNSLSPEKYMKILKEVGFSIIRKEYEGMPGDLEHHLWILAEKRE